MIAFSGLDGAGKSTQILLLQKQFSKINIKSEVFWSRGGYTPNMEYIKKIIRLISNNSTKNKTDVSKRNKAMSNKFIRNIWLIFSIFDLIFYYSIIIRFKEINNKIIICDRYLIDTKIDFKLNFPEIKFENWVIWKFLIASSVKPTKHFVLTIPVDESLKRSIQKNEPFPDSSYVLTQRLNYYTRYSDKNKFVVPLNGLNKIKEIYNLILLEI